jgi:hypothetical protein
MLVVFTVLTTVVLETFTARKICRADLICGCIHSLGHRQRDSPIPPPMNTARAGANTGRTTAIGPGIHAHAPAGVCPASAMACSKAPGRNAHLASAPRLDPGPMRSDTGETQHGIIQVQFGFRAASAQAIRMPPRLYNPAAMRHCLIDLRPSVAIVALSCSTDVTMSAAAARPNKGKTKLDQN